MRRREQAEASRAALVSAARTCFAESGYDGATVSEVLRRAGMARGALYHYFPGGKEELFAVVYREVDDRLHEQLDALEASLTPLQAVRQSAAAFLRLCTRPEFARIVVLEGPRVIPEPGSAHGSVLGRSYLRLRSGVAAAIDGGELAAFDADAVSTALYGALRDLGVRVALAPPNRRRRTCDEALDVLDATIDGLAARPARSRRAAAPARSTRRRSA